MTKRGAMKKSGEAATFTLPFETLSDADGRSGFELGYIIEFDDSTERQERASSFLESLQSFRPVPQALDTLTISVRYPPELNVPFLNNQTHERGGAMVDTIEATLTPLEVLLHPIEGGVAFKCGDDYLRLAMIDLQDTQELTERIAKRNARLGFVLPSALQPEMTPQSSLPQSRIMGFQTTESFSFHTSQEIDIRRRAQCDGKTFNGWFANAQAGSIVYERKNAPHRVSLALTEEERIAGVALDSLTKMIRFQDADAALATEYVLGVLAPPPHLPVRPYAGGWIDFDDVIKKIGWYPQTTAERREMHARVWEFVKFGERAHIVGKRSGAKYKDADGNEIDTTIHGAAWRVMKTETADAKKTASSGAGATAAATPVRAEIVISKELTALLTNANTAQYLQGAEVLGAIPGGKPAGAWARVLGMALTSFWRRHPRETISGTIKPTRRELLDHYAAKVAPYEEVLSGNDPARAIKYWCDALHILVDNGFIERSGEAACDAKEMRQALPRQNWQDAWLDSIVDIEPSEELMKPQIVGRTAALPANRPRDLSKKPRRKPRKNADIDQ